MENKLTVKKRAEVDCVKYTKRNAAIYAEKWWKNRRSWANNACSRQNKGILVLLLVPKKQEIKSTVKMVDSEVY